VHGLGAVFAAVLGFPAITYLIDARNRPARDSALRPVARLSDLPRVNVPKEFVIRESRRDAWTLHPDVEIGRVWLIRREDNAVDAFTTICPHLGCSINCTGQQFLCPCHGGHFDLEGKRIAPATNPAPRDMDRLECQLVRDGDGATSQPDSVILVKYEKFKANQAAKEQDA
jgi:Rieske Fe-S protein